jgi:RNA polymerase sigma-70 factor, ECF subfamily
MAPSAPLPSAEQVARDLAGPLRRYLTRYAGDATLADDLLQETLIRMTRALPGFAGRASLKTWAFSIATRVAADHFRQPAHRLNVIEMEESSDVAGQDAAIDERLVADEMNTCVREVIDSLPEDYRAALVLHELEGLTAEQVAEVLSCSVATAKIRIHRGRVRLREALQGQCRFYRDAENVLRCDRKT